MKRGTPRHKKMYQLAERLSIPIQGAVGLMEMLWHFAGDFTPSGDIGSLPDKEIAHGVSWDGDASVLVKALVDSGWIDRSENHRLIVHDWPEHCEDSVLKKLRYRHKDFVDEYGISANSPQILRKTSDNSPPSREAKAKAVADPPIVDITCSTNPKKNNVAEVSIVRVDPSSDSVLIVEDVCEMYRQGGKAVPQAHADHAVRVLMGKPPETRHRLRNYVAWAFGTGHWKDPTKTKSLYNLLRDGDWDVDLSPRTLPKINDRPKSTLERAADIYREMRNGND